MTTETWPVRLSGLWSKALKFSHNTEAAKIRERYAARKDAGLYSFIRPEVLYAQQEKERALVNWIRNADLQPVNDKRVLEVGCGSGGNLLDFLRMGFLPENLTGNELLEERALQARRLLPE